MDPDGDMDRTDEDQLKCAASLAHRGPLGSLTWLSLNYVDLSSIPEKHLVSLVSRVTRHLTINNVIGCDLVSLLSSLQCEELGIPKVSLGREETQALVQAMESGVGRVVLFEDVTLDIEALTEYSGRGECWDLRLSFDTRGRYREEMRTWARTRNWKVAKCSSFDVYISPSSSFGH